MNSRKAATVSAAVLTIAICVQSPRVFGQDAIPVTENDSWARPLLIVPPEFPKGIAGDAPSIEIRVEGTVGLDGSFKSPVFTTPEGREAYVQAIKNVITYWRFRPALDLERCKPRESKSVLNVYFETKDGKPSISVSSPLGEKSAQALAGRRLVHKPKINFPDAAYSGGIEGSVELLIEVDRDGYVVGNTVLSSLPNRLFGQSVLQEFSKARFSKIESGEGNEKPVCCIFLVTFCLTGIPPRFRDPHCPAE